MGSSLGWVIADLVKFQNNNMKTGFFSPLYMHHPYLVSICTGYFFLRLAYVVKFVNLLS